MMVFHGDESGGRIRKKLSTKEIQVVAQLSHEKKEKKLLLSIILVD